MIEARSEADARKKTIAAPGQITPATLVTGAGTNLRDTRSPPPMPMTPVASATPPTASDGRCQPAARVPEQTRLIHTAPASASVGLQRGLETKIKAMTNPVAMVACPLGNVLSPSNFVDATSNTCDEDLAAQQPDHYKNHEHQHDSGAGDDIQVETVGGRGDFEVDKPRVDDRGVGGPDDDGGRSRCTEVLCKTIRQHVSLASRCRPARSPCPTFGIRFRNRF